MDHIAFQQYQALFESRVIAQGVEKGLLGQIERVSTKPRALARGSFGKVIGTVLDARGALCLDYYGLHKLSRGLMELIGHIRLEEKGTQIRYIECPVVHLSSVRFEDISRLAPDLMEGFPHFKKRVLDLRGFNHSYRP
jgi:hypothetical protein